MHNVIQVRAVIEVPRVLNFLKQIGAGEGAKLPLSALSEDNLRIVGANWTEALVARAKEMRESDENA